MGQAKEKRSIQPEKIHILDFKIVHGQIESSEELDIDKIKGYQYKLGLKTGFNYSKLLAKTDYTIEVETIGVGKNKVRASASFHFVFISFLYSLMN